MEQDRIKIKIMRGTPKSEMHLKLLTTLKNGLPKRKEFPYLRAMASYAGIKGALP